MNTWWLDERGHAGAEHLDPAYVAGYERKAGFDPAEDVDALCRRGLTTESVVVDLGAGTGAFTTAVAPLSREVVAVDISPAMLDVLRARIGAAGLDNVRVIEGGFLSYRHEGAPADFVFTRNALHHLPDFWKAIALDRLAGILRPGGVLRLKDLVFDFDPAAADERIRAWLDGATADPSVGYTSDELAEHVRQEFSTFSWILEEMLERAGFTLLDRRYVRSVYATYTCESVG